MAARKKTEKTGNATRYFCPYTTKGSEGIYEVWVTKVAPKTGVATCDPRRSVKIWGHPQFPMITMQLANLTVSLEAAIAILRERLQSSIEEEKVILERQEQSLKSLNEYESNL